MSLGKDEPIIQYPPKAETRNFNANDIVGEFEKDEKGNHIFKQDSQGNYVDRLGRRVN